MKSLKERQAQREEQRKLLAHGGVIPLPKEDGEEDGEPASADETNVDFFKKYSLPQLKEWILAQGQTLPSEISAYQDVKAYAINLKTYIDENNGQVPANGWKK